EDGIRDKLVTGVQTCALPIYTASNWPGSSAASSMTPGMAEQSQPELPAWLETLRSGERPNASTAGNPNFSAGDLIDEGMLPGWRSEERRVGKECRSRWGRYAE